MPQARLSILCHQAGQVRSTGDAIAASGPSIAALFELDRHRYTPAHAWEEKGQWAVEACACCEGAAIVSSAVRARSQRLLEITCGCLGAPMDRAHVPAFRLLLSPHSELALQRYLMAGRDEVSVMVCGCGIGRGGWGGSP